MDNEATLQRHLTFKHPFTLLIAGPTGSGKTVLVRNILSNFSTLISNMDEATVMWCYGAYQPLFTIPILKVRVQYKNGIPSEDEVADRKCNIVVLGDLMNEMSTIREFSNLFTRTSHHRGKSIFYVVQNIFHKSPNMRDISLNCHYVIILKNPRDKQQVIRFARQIYPSGGKDMKGFVEAYNDATKDPFGYIIMDFTQDTADYMRVRTRILPSNGFHFSPIIYKL